jgi:hypothetical protein
MRFIPTKVHGILDYLVGVLLIAAPWLLGFAQGGAETIVPVVLGAGVILYSLFTDYEYSVVKKIPMPTHLTLDVLGGIFLAASPWILGYSDVIWQPHFIVGIAEVLISMFTQKVPRERHVTERMERHIHAH